MNQRPTKLLCKTTYDAYFTKGRWYDVVYNINDSWDDKDKTITVRDNKENDHLHFVYTQQEREKYKDEKWFDGYGPRDYSKWFYTPDEVRIMKIDKSLENEYEKDNQK